jgi:hypothetical protein
VFGNAIDLGLMLGLALIILTSKPPESKPRPVTLQLRPRLWEWFTSLTIVINVTCAFRITATSAVQGANLACPFPLLGKIPRVRGKDYVLRCAAAKARCQEDSTAGVFAENEAWNIPLSLSIPSA